MTATKRTIANKSKTYLFPLLADYLDLNLEFYSSISNTYVFDKD